MDSWKTDRWKTAVVVFVSLWLPLQGYGAVAMPFCTHGTTNSGIATTSAGDEHAAHGGSGAHGEPEAHDGPGAHAGHEMTGQQHPAGGHHGGSDATIDRISNLACNDCGPCHLACSPALFPHVAVFPVRSAAVFNLPTVAALVSFTPERLQRPPRSALA